MLLLLLPRLLLLLLLFLEVGGICSGLENSGETPPALNNSNTSDSSRSNSSRSSSSNSSSIVRMVVEVIVAVIVMLLLLQVGGVWEMLNRMGCVSKFPDRAKWAPQGRRRRKSVRRRRPHLGPISGRVMAPCDLRGILTTRLRSPLKMQRFEPSIDLDFANGFFEKGCQLNNYFFETFPPSSMRPRDTVEMQGFELVAIFVATSD